MTVYFDRLKVGYPDEHEHPEDWKHSWHVYTVCKAASSHSCTTRANAQGMHGTQDLSDAIRSWGKLLLNAQTGLPLAELYDEKKCHPALTFDHGNSEVKIWRIRGSGAIRIYFLYSGGKRIVVLHTEPKRKDALTKGEKKALKDIATTVLTCIDTYTFEAREI